MEVGRPQVVEIIEEDKQEYESDPNSEEVEEVKNQIIEQQQPEEQKEDVVDLVVPDELDEDLIDQLMLEAQD